MPGGRVRWEAMSSSASSATACSRRINIQNAFVGAAGFAHRAGPLRRDRGGGADQALDGRGRPRGHRHRRPHEVGARRVRHVLPDRRDRRRPDRRAAPPARWSTTCRHAASRSTSSDADGDLGRGRRSPGDADEVDAASRPVDAGRAPPRRRRAPRCAASPSGSGRPRRSPTCRSSCGAARSTRLVGENGAGKSTLVKILAGVHQPDSGHDPARRRATSDPRARPTPARSGSRSSTRSRACSRT